MMRLAASVMLIMTIPIVGGCSGSTDLTTTMPQVVFGEGTLPDAFPEAFPVPEEAVVGSTMTDAGRSVVELVVTIPASVASTVAYFETNLPARGFTVSDSSGDAAQWHADFSGVGITAGVINLGTGGPGITLGTIQIHL